MKRAGERLPDVGPKEKRRRSGDVDKLLESLRRVSLTGIVTTSDRVQLFHLDRKICQGCRTNTKDSPNCFCGLIPPPNSFRKAGLWQKVPKVIENLGPDPADSMRASVDPVGLDNLGATCYVNSVLQCLFMIPAFRSGLLAVEPEIMARNTVLHQLGKIFAQLQQGIRSSVSPSDFASTLQLDNGVQQDGHEFLKLLLSLLETLLGQSRVPRAQHLVQDVFRGSSSYVTRCSTCGRESESSKQAVDFYELEVNVKGFHGLEESLDDYFGEEKLEGDNQYDCEHCQGRVDATRSVKLRSLPPVVSFQLKRFVFNYKTATKKKVSSRFTFPEVLDLGSRLSPLAGANGSQSQGMKMQSNQSQIYDLTAIMVHKGDMASSGHYMAHILHASTGQWWQFNDELVTCLGRHPLGEIHSDTAVPQENGVEHRVNEPGSSDIGVHRGECGTAVSGERRESGAHSSRTGASGALLSSVDAYLLMYTRRTGGPGVGDKGITSSVRMKAGGGLASRIHPVGEGDQKHKLPCSVAETLSEVSASLLDEVEEQNAALEQQCREYAEAKRIQMQQVADRRLEVRQLLAEAAVAGLQDFCWISTEWLRKWADNLLPPGPIDNASLLCRHDKVPHVKIALMKRITLHSWTFLQSKYQGGPQLTSASCCDDCILDAASASVSAQDFRGKRAQMRALVEEMQARRQLEGPLFFVAKNWLNSWLKRKNVDWPMSADAGPTRSLRCPHGNLLPDQAPGAKRQLVNREVWEYLVTVAAEVEGDDSLGHVAYPQSSEECSICQMEISSEASKVEGLRATKLEQKHRHERLFFAAPLPIKPHVQYQLVPTHWIARWRAYLGAVGRNTTAVSIPGNLQNAVGEALCDKHKGLLYWPPALVSKKGQLVQKIESGGFFSLVSEVEWQGLCQEWGGDPHQGILAQLALASTSLHNPPPAAAAETDPALRGSPTATSEDREPALKSEGASPLLATQPQVCQDCLQERESKELAIQLQRMNGEISVELVKGQEPPPSMLMSSGMGACTERRTRRVRRPSASSGGKAMLPITGHTTVRMLKMQIWEAISVVRENQRIGCGAHELNDNELLLGEAGIRPGARLWVVDTGQHEHRDIVEDLVEDDGSFHETEEGFKGTFLLGAASCITSSSQ